MEGTPRGTDLPPVPTSLRLGEVRPCGCPWLGVGCYASCDNCFFGHHRKCVTPGCECRHKCQVVSA